MICPQCKTRNPIGHKFCRECGAPMEAPAGSLAAEEARRADEERTRERVAVLLADAFALSEKRRPDEALPLAEEAAQTLPTSSSARALLASLYEQTEQNDKAIAAQERVVALNPESAADQEKLEQLRRGVHVLPVRARTPARTSTPASRTPAGWLPVAAAVGAAALVLGVGLSVVAWQSAGRGGPSTPDLQPPPAASLQATAGAPNAPNAAATGPSNPAPGRSDPFAPWEGAAERSVPENRAASSGSRAPSSSAPPRASAGAQTTLNLPPPVAGSLAGVPPPRRFPNTANTARPAQAPQNPARASLPPVTPQIDFTASSPQGEERIVARPPSVSSAPAAPPPSDPNNSYIRIQVGPPPGSAASAAPSVPTDPMLRAQSLQAAGRYREAIAAYQQALGSASGTTAGDVYQGIALSQQRLGNAEAARSAYQQAIGAYSAEASAGRNVGAAQRGIASCRAALEVLGGA